jgi:hypothetical protein
LSKRQQIAHVTEVQGEGGRGHDADERPDARTAARLEAAQREAA